MLQSMGLQRVGHNLATKQQQHIQRRIYSLSVHFSSVAQWCLTLCEPMNRSTPGLLSITNSGSSLRLPSIESVMPSSHLILCRPLLLLPPTPTSIRVFSNESTLRMRWPKYWSSDGDCSHEIKRCLLLGRKVMANLDSILKSRDVTLSTKVRLVKAMAFPVVRYGCERWTVKKSECRRIDAFELWCWRRLLIVPWTARRSNQSILKEISPGISLEGMMLKLNSSTSSTSCEELAHFKRL